MPRTKTTRSVLSALSTAFLALALACASPSGMDTDATGDTDTTGADGTGARCGDGVVDDGEACDDGNTDNDDGCSDACQLETCGDGIVQATEECDDGNDDPDDGCDDACRRPPSPPACGNGIVDEGEACDDGNTDDDDGCSGACELESCGDGVVDEGEACDDGVETATCDADCTLATCGDGHTNALAGEECDDGNLIKGDRCNNSCELNTCGDGVVDADEECDDGVETATCDADCTLATCGDGHTNAAAGEACDDGNAVDDDMCSLSCTIPVCDGGDAPDSCGAHLWSKRFGDGGEQHAEAVAVDAQGDVVVAGTFQESMDMGGGVLSSQGGGDLFVAKFSGDGEHLWSKGFGDGDFQTARAVTVDSAGNVVITGGFHGTMNLGGDDLVSQGKSDLFVAKLSPGGEHLWSRSFGDGESQNGRAVTVDGDDNVLITGGLRGTTDLGGGDLVSQDLDLFVAKFSPAGAHLWSQIFGDGETQLGQAIAADKQGDVVLAGNLRGTMDLGGGPLVSAGWIDVFVAKLSGDGGHLWSQRFGEAAHQYASAVAVDGDDNVVLAGYFEGAMSFGGDDLVSAGQRDLYVAKFAPAGEHQWSARFGDGDNQYMEGVALSGAGDILLTGWFEGALDLGAGEIVSQGSYDVFVAKLSAAGAPVWSRRAGDGDWQAGSAIAVDSQGDVLLAGGFASVINLGGDDLVTGGVYDLFLAKLSD